MQFEDFALKSNARAFSSRSKAKAKQNHKDVYLPHNPQKTIRIGERIWTDIEPQDYSLPDYSVSKKLINLLRHRSQLREGMERLNSGD